MQRRTLAVYDRLLGTVLERRFPERGCRPNSGDHAPSTTLTCGIISPILMPLSRVLAGSGRPGLQRRATTDGDCNIRRPMRAAPEREPAGPRMNEDIRVREVRLIDRNRPERRRRRHGRRHGPGHRGRARPGRDITGCQAAGGQDSRLRQVQIPRAEEGRRGAQAAEDRRDQRDQDAPQHRRSRLRREDAGHQALLRGRRQGEGDPALPRPRDGPPGARAGRCCSGSRPTSSRSPRSSRSRAWKAGRW